MTFEEALTALKVGKCVARAIWPSWGLKDVVLYLKRNIGGTAEYGFFLGNERECFQVWRPCMIDLMAEDWEEKPRPPGLDL
jgi:hypothetical protein